MNLNQMPEIPKSVAEEAEKVIGILDQLKGSVPLETIELPESPEIAQEYIRKLEILMKGTLVQFKPEEEGYIHERVDAYIEKLKNISDQQESGDFKIAA